MKTTTEKEYFNIFILLVATIICAWIISMFADSKEQPMKVRHDRYITYDKEGDWLLWDTRPHLEGGVWMPTDGEDFNCTSISDEAASILIN